MQISVSVVINRPKAEVWSAITDIENSQNMITGILALKIIHKPDNGMIGLEDIKNYVEAQSTLT